ncbi:MAG: hypothetical protein AAGF01_12655 [Cyanobacteria bacterium P01_G01_bin.38]
MLVAMPRAKRSYSLDTRVIEGLKELAKDNFTSANRYLEEVLFKHLQAKGVIPDDARPLGELRGGDFTSKKDDIND